MTIFNALAKVDRHLDDLAFAASFAPPIRAVAHCSCGRRMEIRSNQIELTEDERAAAVAIMITGGTADVLVTKIIDAINTVRARAEHEALVEFDESHAYCGDLS